MFLVGILLSVKYSAYRKTIGAILLVSGIAEIIPFILFILGLNDIVLFIPFIPLLIIFIEGCMTLISGLVILFFAKHKTQ